MGLIIDTNVFVLWERSGQNIDFSAWEDRGEAAISVITASELLVGVQRADTEARRQRRSAFVESILTQIPILDFAIEVARVHAELFATLARQGKMIGAHDLIIAATARHRDCSVLTTNIAEFAHVQDLDVIQLPN
ncbi:MAG: type II toxin-antitoxin system VapC family toxin [Planctomycetota bacterium]|nr:type II toxin-antitoxin system VapC family toxin [Planctomycetota bacterium]